MKILLLVASAFIAPIFWTQAQAQSALDDHQIAAIITAAHALDIESGTLAQFKSSSAEVRFFAQRMVADHTTALESLTELITRLGITPRENTISQGLKSSADKNIARLKPLRGEAFDKEYINFEIPFHEHMLEMIDNELIHNVKNEQLKGALVKTRPLFFHTYEQAIRVESILKKEPPRQKYQCCAH
ncbi:putative membrane protein [Nitrosospira sp. Nsp2]|uniref:DUF4142 domain-containing protein n=1 Tax=Nitrosospira sp. Nsp2 TaxID=136548 RepID=UPI000D30D5B3|nr:DUF4142 domain-containing protein [Nitrosospira sp. Nsp2]PTR16085.1 putative membrane protein [Nitrosospira sp. Nsp2]